MNVLFERWKMAIVSFELEDKDLKDLDEKRGLIGRSVILRECVKHYLKGDFKIGE